MTAVWNPRGRNLWTGTRSAGRTAPAFRNPAAAGRGHGEGEAAGQEERPAWKAEERMGRRCAAILEDYAQQMREEAVKGAAAGKDEAWQWVRGRFMGRSDDYEA